MGERVKVEVGQVRTYPNDHEPYRGDYVVLQVRTKQARLRRLREDDGVVLTCWCQIAKLETWPVIPAVGTEGEG